MDENMVIEERLKPETKRNGLKMFDGFLWVFTVIVGVVTGIAGSLAVSVASMNNYATLYNQWIGTDTEITNAEAKEALEWIMVSPWTVYFQSPKAQDDFLSSMILVLTGLGILFLAGTVLLCVFSGRFSREEDGTIHLNWFDRIWSEVHLALFCCAAAAAVMLAYPMVMMWPGIKALPSLYVPVNEDLYCFGPNNTTIFVLCIAGMILAIALALICFVSLVKKLKAHKFWEKSLIGKIFHGVGSGVSAGVGAVVNAVRTTDNFMLKYVGLLLGMVFLAMTWIGAILDLVLIFIFVPKKVKKFQEIRSGVDRVKAGELSYKIPVGTGRSGKPETELDRLAADINCISDASEAAVQNELKTQRMKTELISNVSHDLKTPLTSMVSYIDLLKKEGLESPNASEYLKILDEKTERLKVLTEELFEAAKASSGAIPVNKEAIDLGSLVSQSLGEMDARLKARGLDIIVSNACAEAKNAEKSGADAEAGSLGGGPKVIADGQLLWRVIENLLGNVSKYALENSRVYVNIGRKNDSVLLEVKNISKDALNISEEELMERFTRGDASRNTEGSGLGLAIARDLVRLMDGKFDITIDGDLFKASVLLKESDEKK